ncbi:MAG: hypothetical protein GX651_07445 [Methanomicrobiales archaeon]|nr:hypothetical protein [Methanomicrobiales archaeon]
MAGTTAEIARLVTSGSLTLAECARMLGMHRAQLDERLFLMERQGYLARATPHNVDAGTCSGCCSKCTCRGAKNPGAAPAVYSITEKGERLAARKE